jgi:hypothetical protein
MAPAKPIASSSFNLGNFIILILKVNNWDAKTSKASADRKAEMRRRPPQIDNAALNVILESVFTRTTT